MLRKIILALVLLFAPVSAYADDLEGAWALRIDGTNIFRFDLREISDGVWRGTWTRPDTFRSNGAVFTQARGQEELDSMAGLDNSGEVELSFDDPRPGAVPDIFRFRLVGEGQVAMTYVGTDLAPYPLVRVAEGAALGPFADGRIYDRDNAQTIPEPVEVAGGSDLLLPPEDELALPAQEGEDLVPLDNFRRDDEQAVAREDTVPEQDRAADRVDQAPAAAPAEVWQPDASVRAAVAARAQSLGEAPPVEEPAAPVAQPLPAPAPPTEASSQIGDDFLDGF